MKRIQTRRIGDPMSTGIALIIIASLVIFNVLPLLEILIKSFQAEETKAFSLNGYADALAYKENQRAIIHTLFTSTVSAFFATIIGFVFAYSSCYVKMKAKKLFDFVALLPLISPPFAVSLAIILLFGAKGLITRTILGIRNANIYGVTGLILSQVFTFFPMAYLTLKGVLVTIDPSVEEAARDMGASRWKTFWKVTFPLALPGIGNSFLLIFIKCVADFSNPKFIAGTYSTMATQIYFQALGGYGMQRCCALSMLLLIFAVIFFVLSQSVLSKRTYVTITGKATRERNMIEDKHIKIPLEVVCSIVCFFVLLLYLMIPATSFVKLWGMDYSLTLDNYKLAWKMGKAALFDTVELACITTPVNGLLAMVMAFLIVRKKSKGTGIMRTLGMMGMVIPGTILGYAYILRFNTKPLLLTGTMLILVASCISRYLPVGLTTGITSLKQIDPSIEEAASDLGANSAQVFVKVTIPLIKTAFFGGLVYTFIRTMTSMSALVFLTSAKHKILTTSIMNMVEDGRYGAATALGTIMILVVIVSIGIIYALIGLFGVNKKQVKLL